MASSRDYLPRGTWNESFESERHSCSDTLRYSSNTFESDTDGNECSEKSDSRLLDSYYSDEELESKAVSSTSVVKSESEYLSSLVGYEDETFESLDVSSGTAEEKFIERTIHILKDGGLFCRNFTSERKEQRDMIENGEVLDGDSDALKSFCFAKIKQIQQQWEVKQPQDTEHETMSPTTKPRKPKEFFMTRSVPEKLLKRLQFRNITEMLKQAEAAEIHQPSHCTACLKKKEELAKAEFIKQKKALVESANLKEKIENQMYIRDPLTLIGEVLENFPKLSDDPSEIWKRLTAKLKK